MKILYMLFLMLLVSVIILALVYISQNNNFPNQVLGYVVIIIAINGVIFGYKKVSTKKEK